VDSTHHRYTNRIDVVVIGINHLAFVLLKSLDSQRQANLLRVSDVICAESGYSKLRRAMINCVGPTIPFLGLILTDLRFVEDAFPEYIDPPCINWNKCEHRYLIVNQLFQYDWTQAIELEIDSSTRDLTHIIELLQSDESEQYDFSLWVEPRALCSAPCVSSIVAHLSYLGNSDSKARKSTSELAVEQVAQRLSSAGWAPESHIRMRCDDATLATRDFTEWLVSLVSAEKIERDRSFATWLLHSSVELDLIGVVRRLLELGIDPNSRLRQEDDDDDKERSATTMVISNPAIERLVQARVPSRTALFVCRSEEMMRLLVSFNADLEARNQWLQTPLIAAAAADGDAARAQWLIALKADINARMDGGFTALHVAASRHDPELVLELLLARADVMALSLWGTTTTMEAAMSDDADVTKLLLYHHAPGFLVDPPRKRSREQVKLSHEMSEMLSEDRVAELQAYGVWNHATHHLASEDHRTTIRVLMDLHTLEPTSLIGVLPRELLWLLFSFLNCK